MNEPIHVAIIRRVKSGRERDFERELLAFAQRSLVESGTRGVHLIYPSLSSGSNEYGILRTFASDSHRAAFYKTTLYSEWLATIEPLVDGEPEYRKLHGLEAWFRNLPSDRPPLWKMAMATYLGVVPVVMFLALTLGRITRKWNFVLNNMVFNAFVVALLTWVVMPLITRALRGWLNPQSEKSSL